MDYGFSYTRHAVQRSAMRGLTHWDVEYILQHGIRMSVRGAVHFLLRRNDIPVEDRSNQSISRLEGARVVMDPRYEQAVITVYRHKYASRRRHMARLEALSEDGLERWPAWAD